jgi:DNA-binding transcriptional regulator GbsR (MarR family)
VGHQPHDGGDPRALYIYGQPLCTDDVMERLNISRGNASMSLRGLCDWGIIRRLHKRGERREYFESLGDVWEMFSIIAAERKRREMDRCSKTIRHLASRCWDEVQRSERPPKQ